MAAKLFEHPFDLCKVRLQSQVLDATARFNGPLDCLYKTWKYEGIRGLYRGLPPPVLGAAAENAVLFLTYNNLRRLFGRLDPERVQQAGGSVPLPHTLVAAGGAGIATSFVLTPIELVKCKMQVQMLVTNPGSASGAVNISELPGPIQILRGVIRESGVKGLWLGHTGTLIRECGGGVAWFGIKELSSRYLISLHQPTLTSSSKNSSPSAASSDASLPSVSDIDTSTSPPIITSTQSTESKLAPWESALSGAVAGIGYTILLFPADCVKSTIQTEEELRPTLAGKAARRRPTFTGVFMEIWRSKGVKGLYAGAGVTTFRSAVSSGLMFLIYDALESRFG